jgi:AcrR family transcriptional regulator
VRSALDRRVRRTRRALHDALLALMIEKGYDAVTVQDVIDRADVGRSTFYSHFTDKRDLLDHGLDELRAMLQQPEVARPAGRDRLFRFSFAMFAHARDQRLLVQALVSGPGGGPVLGGLQRVLGETVRAELTALVVWHRTGPTPDEIVVAYVVGAFLAVLTGWLTVAPDRTPEQVDETFHMLVAPGVRSALGL